MKRNEKPIKNSPIDLLRLLLLKSRGMESPITGRTKADMFTLKPKRAIIHAVNVVPTFAPMITAMDCPSDIRPALTKLTTITVEADENTGEHTGEPVARHSRKDIPEAIACGFLQAFAHHFHTIKKKGYGPEEAEQV